MCFIIIGCTINLWKYAPSKFLLLYFIFLNEIITMSVHQSHCLSVSVLCVFNRLSVYRRICITFIANSSILLNIR